MKMTNFVFGLTLRVNGSYRQTVTNVETGAAFSRRSGRDGKIADVLVTPGTCVDTLTLLDELVAAWQAAWQADEELETQARLQSEESGYVTLNHLRRTWGDWWISGDRPTWAVVGIEGN